MTLDQLLTYSPKLISPRFHNLASVPWFTQLLRPNAVGNGNPLQYSCQEDSVNRGVWEATAYGVAELDTIEQLSTHAHTQAKLLGEGFSGTTHIQSISKSCLLAYNTVSESEFSLHPPVLRVWGWASTISRPHLCISNRLLRALHAGALALSPSPTPSDRPALHMAPGDPFKR